ncbi:hypothetical protein [Paenibacillus sp. yr247]|uniref:hypothetical protein n=1 Tax=Paenibacillus sp. yr247 TaxID=1761880 RepID=UPI001586F90A|nr:hypothetical protein [Paenibacillus sp. yr247]
MVGYLYLSYKDRRTYYITEGAVYAVYAVERIRRGWLTESIAVNTQQRKFEGGLRR